MQCTHKMSRQNAVRSSQDKSSPALNVRTPNNANYVSPCARQRTQRLQTAIDGGAELLGADRAVAIARDRVAQRRETSQLGVQRHGEQVMTER